MSSVESLDDPDEDETEETIEERLDQLEDDYEARLTRLERLTDILRENYKDEKEARKEVGEELLHARERIAELEDEVDSLENDLDDQTEIMRRAMRSSSLKPAERAALLVQIMWRDAKSNPNRKATMTVSEAVDCLQRDVTRNAFYGDSGTFQKAVDLVGDEDVLYLVEESRASKRNTRLVLDLEDGTPPKTADGFDLTPQEAD